MIFRQLFDSESSTYSYLLGDEETRQAILIDSVLGSTEKTLLLLEQLDLKLCIALDSHTHADHITGLGALRDDPALADDDEVVESLVSLDNFMGHAFGGPLHVIGGHDPGSGNKNAPIWGRKASFAFSHVRGPSCPYGPHGTRFTVRRRVYRVLANRACYR